MASAELLQNEENGVQNQAAEKAREYELSFVDSLSAIADAANATACWFYGQSDNVGMLCLRRQHLLTAGPLGTFCLLLSLEREAADCCSSWDILLTALSREREAADCCSSWDILLTA